MTAFIFAVALLVAFALGVGVGCVATLLAVAEDRAETAEAALAKAIKDKGND